MLTLFHWMVEYWVLILYLIVIIVGYIVGGQRIALAVATFGAIGLSYGHGRKTERNTQKENATRINQEREEAYEEIHNRNTSRDDVVKRLQKRDY